jgi:hypothetical protein
MVTRLLKSCGLILGPDAQLVGPDAGNIDGHFEHMGFVKINDAILSHFGGSGASPPLLRAGWEVEPEIAEYAREAKLLVESFRGYPLWGWKDPRTTLLLPFWKKIVPQLRYVICVRSPLEVARSLWARDRIPVEQGAFLWNRYITAAIRNTDGGPRIFTFYDDFFREPLREIERLVDFCGLGLPADPTTIVDTVSTPLRHHVSTLMDLLAEEKVLIEHKLFYLSLRALSLVPLSGNQDVEMTSAACGKLAALIDELHSEHKLIELRSALAERDLALKRLVEENRSLTVSLDSIARSLTWQLSKKLEIFKERVLPGNTRLRKLYDRLLIRMKKLSFLRPPA